MKASNTFNAREDELTKLNNFLELAAQSQGQLCFIAGEAGSGRTALVSHFTQMAQEKNEDLVAAVGLCDPQTGAGAPYLPFRPIRKGD